MEHVFSETEPGQVILKFGGGLHDRASPDEINLRECFDGKNFDIDIENSFFTRRPAVDQVATVPNGEPVKGGAQLKRADGTISTLIQGGGTVYEWDGSSSGFTSVGSVSSAARLRGFKDQNFTSLEQVLITDLNLSETVKKWDGNTFEDLGANLTDFRARYCVVDFDRAFFGNVQSGATATPHVLVGSEIDDPTNLSVSDRPASAVGGSDPFFVSAPDLKPINGLIAAFNTVTFSTRKGRIFRLIGGATTQDFSVVQLQSSEGAAGEESLVLMGNDIAIGTDGRIDTVFGVESFGDARTDDLSRQLANIDTIRDWTLAYNERVQKLYCFARFNSKVFVMNKPFLDEIVRRRIFRGQAEGLSPWSVYTTDTAFGFQPESVFVMERPGDQQLTTYMGGTNGEVFAVEGTGGQDLGTTDVVSDRLSGLISIPTAEMYDIHGWVKYRRNFMSTLNITFEAQGEQFFDRAVQVELAGATNRPVYNGSLYYKDGNYYSTRFKQRVARKHFDISAKATDVQIRASITGSTDFNIQEIGIQFQAST